MRGGAPGGAPPRAVRRRLPRRYRRGRMAELVRDIMEATPVTVSPETSVEDVVGTLRQHELPGVPVVDGDGRCVGIVTEADLVLPDEQGDLHIPHYVNLFGGTVFLEPLGRFEQRLRKAFASTAADMMTSKPDTVAPDTTVQEPAQLERFREFVDAVGRDDLLVHAANSAATYRDPAAHFDLVRCGIAIYGMDPFGEDPGQRGLEPALSLHSWVAAVRRFETGESAGYGRRWETSKPTWVATVPIGYGDGWRRALTNDCDVLIRGRRFPLVGTVSMDNVTVDLGGETDVSVGDEVVLMGRQGDERILAEEVARRLDTINYEITCGLLPRVRRLHVR